MAKTDALDLTVRIRTECPPHNWKIVLSGDDTYKQRSCDRCKTVERTRATAPWPEDCQHRWIETQLGSTIRRLCLLCNTEEDLPETDRDAVRDTVDISQYIKNFRLTEELIESITVPNSQDGKPPDSSEIVLRGLYEDEIVLRGLYEDVVATGAELSKGERDITNRSNRALAKISRRAKIPGTPFVITFRNPVSREFMDAITNAALDAVEEKQPLVIAGVAPEDFQIFDLRTRMPLQPVRVVTDSSEKTFRLAAFRKNVRVSIQKKKKKNVMFVYDADTGEEFRVPINYGPKLLNAHLGQRIAFLAFHRHPETGECPYALPGASSAAKMRISGTVVRINDSTLELPERMIRLQDAE